MHALLLFSLILCPIVEGNIGAVLRLLPVIDNV